MEPGRKADDKVVFNPHQVSVKGPVVERVQAKAIFRVQTVLLVLGPGDDVAGREQRLDGQAGHTTAEIVGGEDAAAEKTLVHAHAHGGFAFKPGGGQVIGVHVRHFLNGFAQPVGQQPLAFKRQRFRVARQIRAKFPPRPWRHAASHECRAPATPGRAGRSWKVSGTPNRRCDPAAAPVG